MPAIAVIICERYIFVQQIFCNCFFTANKHGILIIALPWWNPVMFSSNVSLVLVNDTSCLPFYWMKKHHNYYSPFPVIILFFWLQKKQLEEEKAALFRSQFLQMASPSASKPPTPPRSKGRFIIGCNNNIYLNLK